MQRAPVAQLDRAAASEAVGQKFESSRAHHISSLRASIPRIAPEMNEYLLMRPNGFHQAFGWGWALARRMR